MRWLKIVKDGEAPLWGTGYEGRRIYQAILREEERLTKAREPGYFKGCIKWDQLMEASSEYVNTNRILYKQRKPVHACMGCEFNAKHQGPVSAWWARMDHYSTKPEGERELPLGKRTHPSEAWVVQANAEDEKIDKIEMTQRGHLLDQEDIDKALQHQGRPTWKVKGEQWQIREASNRAGKGEGKSSEENLSPAVQEMMRRERR